MTERVSEAGESELFQRAIAELRTLDGAPDEVAALALRMHAQLSAAASPASLHASRVPGGAWLRARPWLVSGVVLIGAAGWYGAASRAPATQLLPTPLAQPAAAGVPLALAAQPAATAAVAAPLETPAPVPLERAAPPSLRRPAAKSRASNRAATRASAQSSAELELKLITAAQAVLDRQPTQALSLAGQHAREYPHGLFAEEREVIALEAELKLQRSAGASVRARRFLAEYPRSTHARKVQLLIDRKRE